MSGKINCVEIEADLRKSKDLLAKNEVSKKWKKVKEVVTTRDFTQIQPTIHEFEETVLNNFSIKSLKERRTYWNFREYVLKNSANGGKQGSSAPQTGIHSQPTGSNNEKENLIREKIEQIHRMLNITTKAASEQTDGREIILLNAIVETIEPMKRHENAVIKTVNELSTGNKMATVTECIHYLSDLIPQLKSLTQNQTGDIPRAPERSKSQSQVQRNPYTFHVIDKLHRIIIQGSSVDRHRQKHDSTTVSTMDDTELQAKQLTEYFQKSGYPVKAARVEVDEKRHEKESRQQHPDIPEMPIAKLHQQITDLKEELQSATKEILYWKDRYSGDISGNGEKLKQLEADLSSAEKDKKYWIDRASRVAGSKLTENNPGISDLSDPDRPQKLAERYGEIYDNIWTEALEKLKPPNETDGVKKLCNVLKTCQKRCRDYTDMIVRQVESNLFQVIGGPKMKPEDVSDPIRKSLQKNFMKCIYEVSHSPVIIKTVEKLLVDSVLKDHKKDQEKITGYVKACVSLCWKMVIKNPPLSFIWPDAGKDQVVDEDRFTFYTRSGKYIEFVVWPAMLLCEGGPLLKKGVVQPFPKK